MTLKALIVVGLANVTVAVTLGCANDRGRPTMTAVELLDRVGRLTALPGMNKVDVERILETRLTARTQESNRFFVIYRSENAPNAGGIIKAIEVREPTARGGGKGALLVIELESQGSLAAADVVRKLGQPGELRAPAHSGPNDEAVAYVYKIPAGELRFAIGRSDREPVLSIVIDQSG